MYVNNTRRVRGLYESARRDPMFYIWAFILGMAVWLLRIWAIQWLLNLVLASWLPEVPPLRYWDVGCLLPAMILLTYRSK
jgi:hypothetical protein